MTPQAQGGGVYSIANQVVDLYMPLNGSMEFKFTFPDLPPSSAFSSVHVDGDLYLDRFDNTYKIQWNHRNQPTRIEVFTTPATTIAPGDPPPAKDSAPVGTIEFKYDALGQRVARVRQAPSSPPPGVTPFTERTEYYVNEAGKLLLQFDEAQQLERHNLWAANVDRLLAVEDMQYDNAHALTGTQVIWPVTDYQGTVRNLYVEGATPPTMHLTYDPFGKPQQPGAFVDEGTLDALVRFRQYGTSTIQTWNCTWPAANSTLRGRAV